MPLLGGAHGHAGRKTLEFVGFLNEIKEAKKKKASASMDHNALHAMSSWVAHYIIIYYYYSVCSALCCVLQMYSSNIHG